MSSSWGSSKGRSNDPLVAVYEVELEGLDAIRINLLEFRPIDAEVIAFWLGAVAGWLLAGRERSEQIASCIRKEGRWPDASELVKTKFTPEG